ncbi:hypothetical protein GCM10007919_58780 [Rhizobium indigoferae]|nr:hypothetical protein GCM10007919_58780 [Rhizobium indigoferae]
MERDVIIDGDDTIPHPDLCCGIEPDAVYGPASVISCQKCRETAAVDTPPFFRDAARQREHEAWRAVLAWNARPILSGEP